jgi:hypothetical protein
MICVNFRMRIEGRARLLHSDGSGLIEDRSMIEFRWMAMLALWTILIGPVLDFAHKSQPAPQARAKAPMAKTRLR